MVLFVLGKIHVLLSNFSSFLTEPLSEDTVDDIAGMLLGILKRLRNTLKNYVERKDSARTVNLSSFTF